MQNILIGEHIVLVNFQLLRETLFETKDPSSYLDRPLKLIVLSSALYYKAYRLAGDKIHG